MNSSKRCDDEMNDDAKNPRSGVDFYRSVRLHGVLKPHEPVVNSDVEQEVHHIAIFDDVLFAF